MTRLIVPRSPVIGYHVAIFFVFPASHFTTTQKTRFRVTCVNEQWRLLPCVCVSCLVCIWLHCVDFITHVNDILIILILLRDNCFNYDFITDIFNRMQFKFVPRQKSNLFWCKFYPKLVLLSEQLVVIIFGSTKTQRSAKNSWKFAFCCWAKRKTNRICALDKKWIS